MKRFLEKLMLYTSALMLTCAPSAFAMTHTKDVVLSERHGTIVHDSHGGCVRTQWEAFTDKCAESDWCYDEAKTEKKYAVIFFDFDKADVKEAAYKTIHKLYQNIKSNKTHAMIYIHGHTDTTGTHEYNTKLSKRRAESVKHELVKLGVPAHHIETHGHAYDQLLVQTPMNTREIKNRRAEVYYKVVYVERHSKNDARKAATAHEAPRAQHANKAAAHKPAHQGSSSSAQQHHNQKQNHSAATAHVADSATHQEEKSGY